MTYDSFSDAFEKETRDLVAECHAGKTGNVFHRDTEARRALDLLDRRQSVLILGQAGVGKTSVIHRIACIMYNRGEGNLRVLSTTVPLAGTRYLGEWETKLSTIVESAINTGTALYISDIWNLPFAGKSSNVPKSFWDAIRPVVEEGRLCLLGEVTPETLRRMHEVEGFSSLFQIVSLAPLPDSQVDDILKIVASDAGFAIDGAARQTLISLTSRFLSGRAQPGPALNLLKQTIHYHGEKCAIGQPEPVTPGFIEKVFSIYTGLPKLVVSRQTVMPVRDIRGWFHDHIVGQTDAVEAVTEAIALFKAELHDPHKPIGTFFFVGPTGVGKTEMARALAEFFFGSPNRLLRFDLSEFKDYHSFEMLLGSQQRPEQPARLIDPIRAQPFQVILFDEIEKAHPNISDLLLQLLDEGRLSTPSGGTVSFLSTIIIATSNVGAEESSRNLGFNTNPALQDRHKDFFRALERNFRPELLNRFQHMIVFRSLTRDQVRKIALLELNRILDREGIKARDLIIDVDEKALDLAISHGFDPRYGARALKREIQKSLVLPLAITIMERNIEPGSIIKVFESDGHVKVHVLEAPEGLARNKEKASVRTGDGKRLTRTELMRIATETSKEIERIAEDMGEERLKRERRRLLDLRNMPEFWSNSERAILIIRDLDLNTSMLDRVDRLRFEAEDIERRLEKTEIRREIESLYARSEHLRESIKTAYRELSLIGIDGIWDALVEIQPVGAASGMARDFILDILLDWAKHRHMETMWFREPLRDNEPAMIAIKGDYAYGYLALEAGLHRIRTKEGDTRTSIAARIAVAPWKEHKQTPTLRSRHALKTIGKRGGKIRSRLEYEGGLVLQNSRTLTENGDLAIQIAHSWYQTSTSPDHVVRQVELEPGFRLHDYLSGINTGKKHVLTPKGFHELLCKRLEAAKSRQT